MSTTSEASSVEEEWPRYPTNLKHYDPIAFDAECIGHLDQLSDVIFSKGTKLEVLESLESSVLLRREIENADALDVFLSANLAPPSLRVMHVTAPYFGSDADVFSVQSGRSIRCLR